MNRVSKWEKPGASSQRNSAFAEHALPYRRDIDGLRGLAVLAVVAFHAFPEFLPGGFVGVDVFFVISGYLISGIVFKNLRRNSFSLSGFYARRIRRIFPALLAILVACLLMGWHVMLENEYQRLGKHVAAGAAFVANFSLWNEAGYFDSNTELKPLLHLWSLGIEEQFYIFWPLLLLVAYRKSMPLFRLTALIAVASFVLNICVTHASTTMAFYFPLTRAWELMLGAFLAHWFEIGAPRPRWMSTRHFTVELREKNALAWLGILGILGSFAIVDRYRDFPGWWVVLPTLGTAALIAVGPETWFNRRVLGNRIAVGIGLVSYPLYLWHWPLLSFARIVNTGKHVHSIELGVVALSFVLAWATYRFIEQPVRLRRRVSPSTLVVLMCLVAATGSVIFAGLVRPRSADYGLEKIVSLKPEVEFPGEHLVPLFFHGQKFFREGKGMGNTLFIGDSTIEQYYMRIDKLLAEHPDSTRGVVFATSHNCLPIPNVIEVKQRHWCRAFVQDAFDYAMDSSIDAVVIGGQWYLNISNTDPNVDYAYDDRGINRSLGVRSPGAEMAYSAFGQIVSTLVHRGKKVYVVLNIPVSEDLDPANLVERSLMYGFRMKQTRVDERSIVERFAPVMPKLAAAALESGAVVIDPIQFLCDGHACSAVTTDGYPIYRDRSHLRPSFARDFVSYLDGTVSP
jgi:peptidoglycan/LPS O-acetylase OafA/YrhL